MTFIEETRIVALVFLNPFYRDTTRYLVTTLLSNYFRSVSRLHISARAEI